MPHTIEAENKTRGKLALPIEYTHFAMALLGEQKTNDNIYEQDEALLSECMRPLLSFKQCLYSEFTVGEVTPSSLGRVRSFPPLLFLDGEPH